MSIEIQVVSGQELLPYIDAVAQLRMAVFREYPYLYEGSLAYEQRYLQTYINTSDCIFVLVSEGKKVIGVSTALPLTAETMALKQPFLEQHYDLNQIFYFGESVLLPRYRNQGIGVRFFAEREAHAKQLHFKYAAFCTVQRAEEHPLRPPHYQPLDDFWHKRGYTRHPELKAWFSWREVNETEESLKPMVFWLKQL